ncbi:LytTR family DNA-binding domain-containing protein, partial [Aneurinibacillus aneurinilyticus]|nr:LytTR family DNA-binding domain-containing protein [Aneurinibacillus aneurinilyticus]
PEISALFIDYQLDGRMTGLDAYMILQQRGHTLPAVLITGEKLDANRTYDLGILDVVEKPYTPYRIQKAFEKLHAYLSYSHFSRNGGLYVPIHDQEIRMLMPSDILFFEAESKIVKVHTLDGVLKTKIPLKLYEKYLQHTSFFYSHRAFLVNVKKIHYIEGNKIHFRDTNHVAQVTDEKQLDVRNLWRKFSIL